MDFSNKLSEWVFERIYTSCVKRFDFCDGYYDEEESNNQIAELSEIIHLSRTLGYKHVAPRASQPTITASSNKSLSATALTNASVFEMEKMSIDGQGISTFTQNITKIEDRGNFECVYITKSSHPLSHFASRHN